MNDLSTWISVKEKLPTRYSKVHVMGFSYPLYLNNYDQWLYPSGMVASHLHPNNQWKPLEKEPK